MLLNDKVLEVLEAFSSDYRKEIYGREIAKRQHMNQKTVANVLNRLEKDNVIKFSREGKNKYYYLNHNSAEIKEVIKFIEIGKKIKFLNKYKKLRELFAKLEERTKGLLVVFGSYATFSSTEKSDLDVFLIGSIENVEDLEQLYSIKINIIKSERSKFNSKEPLIKEILKSHIILKGLEEFIELAWQ
jgi:predicted transcriptional regulator